MIVIVDVIIFRNGIINGFKGKFVVFWSFVWNFFIDKWEF